jgi:hypothetical protein
MLGVRTALGVRLAASLAGIETHPVIVSED